MVVAYKRPFTDAGYDPLPHDIVIRDNVHGRAGWAPGFAGGKELAAAMGGSSAPIFWDGAGGAATHVQVRDKVTTITLGLATPLTPLAEAKSAPIDLSGGTARWRNPSRSCCPASMEAALR